MFGLVLCLNIVKAKVMYSPQNEGVKVKFYASTWLDDSAQLFGVTLV